MKVTCLINAKIWLGQQNFAQAVLFNEQKIIKVATQQEILSEISKDVEIIDCQGRLVIPGFNDSHLHLYNTGINLSNLDLRGVTSLEEVLRQAKKFIIENNPSPNTLVQGRGWNDDYFTDEKRMLTRHDLDQVTTQHPFFLKRACGHVVTLNTKACEQLHLFDEIPVIEGGQIEVDEQGVVTGILSENAMNLLAQLQQDISVDEIKSILEKAIQYANENGLTSVASNDYMDCDGLGEKMLEAFYQLEQEGRLSLRVVAQCCLTSVETLEKFLTSYTTNVGTEVFKIGPLKLLVDGSLGARTALMRKPYADQPTTKGIATFSQIQLDQLVQLASKNKMQVACHAIGDGAIQMVLDAYEKVNSDHQNTLRHGIVHCQITDEALLQRFSQDRIGAYVQPIFLHYDQHIVNQRVGTQLASTSYAFKTMDDLTIAQSFGTDCPVEDLNPFENLYCAITRKDLTHPTAPGFCVEQALTMQTSLQHYTQDGAWFSFEEHKKGKIEAGFLPDLVVLSQDLFTCPCEEIKTTKAWLTICQGRIVYSSN